MLITENRHADEPDSLEMVIRDENHPDRLPVVTLADPRRTTRDRLHAQMVAERVLDYLMRIDEVRGTGRIYVPRGAREDAPDRPPHAIGGHHGPQAPA